MLHSPSSALSPPRVLEVFLKAARLGFGADVIVFPGISALLFLKGTCKKYQLLG